ncbi:hypothetical protein G7Z17_g4283 [Cylindrodendrum hubeiense]|uniref:DUF1993 domain-containing protein n=1 Tax=Cylindrodendrum hubeiense TaxID=595255 RepID=A0A9P5LHC1_9HYPO|nr:hypothetical protein G7Z17_g4283 [Cylindrodendrum hubeiense]
MSYTLYDGSIVPAQDALNALSAILTKAEAHITDSAGLFAAKLHEDMLPFTFQVYFASDVAQKLAARGTGVEPLALDRNFESFADMQALVKKVLDVLANVDKDAFNARETAEVTVGLGPGKEVKMQLRQYVNGYVLPNVFFHVNTAYAILRKEGVPIGKQDYLTPFIGKYAA